MTVRSGDRIATGVNDTRRRLAVEEAQAGGLPEPFTAREWRTMRRATLAYAHALGIPDRIETSPLVGSAR
jgi:hypothetical protein